MTDKANERTFQDDIIEQLLANGWLLGNPEGYNRELALYEEDVLGFVKDTQPKQWDKSQVYPTDTATKLLERVAATLIKSQCGGCHHAYLRHAWRCAMNSNIAAHASSPQFEPEHNLKVDTLRIYQQNRLRGAGVGLQPVGDR